MADEKQSGQDEKAKAGNRKAAASEQPRYASAEHIKGARAMYGVPSHFVAGALALREESKDAPEDGYTKSEVESAVEAFRRHDLTKEN